MTLQLLTSKTLIGETDCFQVFAMVKSTLANDLQYYTLHIRPDPDFSWLPTDLSESWGLVVLFTLERKKKVIYLITQVHVGISAEKQWHHVHMSFLSCKMDRSNSLPGNCVCISTIFQQSCRYVHLVLFGSDVQRCITILSTWITWSHAQEQGKNVCSAFSIVCLPISWFFLFDGLKTQE